MSAPETPPPRDRLALAWRWARKNAAGAGLELIFNAILPVLIYDFEHARMGDVGSLLAASAAPIGWSIFQFARRRRLDAVSILVLVGIALSLAAFFGGGGAKFLQLRENLVTGLIGVVFLASAVIRRPLIFHLARASMLRDSPTEEQTFRALRRNAYVHRTMMVMTVVWGFGLIAQMLAAVALVFTVSISTYLIASPFLGYAFIGSLIGWTFLYARRKRLIGRLRPPDPRPEQTPSEEATAEPG